jgi:hypothetical protein
MPSTRLFFHGKLEFVPPISKNDHRQNISVAIYVLAEAGCLPLSNMFLPKFFLRRCGTHWTPVLILSLECCGKHDHVLRWLKKSDELGGYLPVRGKTDVEKCLRR